MRFSLIPPPTEMTYIVPYTLEEAWDCLKTPRRAKPHQAMDIQSRVTHHIILEDSCQFAIKKSDRHFFMLAEGILQSQSDFTTLVKMQIAYRYSSTHLVLIACLIWCFIFVFDGMAHVAIFVAIFALGLHFVGLRVMRQEQELWAKVLQRRLFDPEDSKKS